LGGALHDRGAQLTNEHMAQQQISAGSINATALRFFFNVTLERPDLFVPWAAVNKPPKLSQEEMARLPEAAPGLSNSPMIQNDKVDAAPGTARIGVDGTLWSAGAEVGRRLSGQDHNVLLPRIARPTKAEARAAMRHAPAAPKSRSSDARGDERDRRRLPACAQTLSPSVEDEASAPPFPHVQFLISGMSSP
jgi:hypothetical protein